MSTAVKICGITRAGDAQTAVRLGAHALGFVFYAKSPRNIVADQAAAIVRGLPPFVTAVGLFVDPEASEVEYVMERMPLNLLQFHGAETPQFCTQFHVPYLKAVRVRFEVNLIEYARSHPTARGLLLDAYVEGTHGGTGTAFDWSLIPSALPLPVVLSGGLNADNVAEAIRRVRPAAVDVSSGVEYAPGLKDERKIAAFMQGVRSADG